MRRLLLLLVPALVSAQDPSLEAARRLVHDFFSAHFKGEMAFTDDSIRSKARFLSPALAKACLAKNAEAADRGTEEAPDINGDPFTDSQEYPDAFKAGKVYGTDGGARVLVTLTWKGGNPPRSLVVLLKNLKEGWRIDDLRYADGRTLRSLLKPAGPATK